MEKIAPVRRPVVVALRKESVDRNPGRLGVSPVISVALRKESVDRNAVVDVSVIGDARSLSARRAWIEIVCAAVFCRCVDGSLSARRAWIEICCSRWLLASKSWSLSARRAWIEIYNLSDIDDKFSGRSPQGERG